MKLNFDCIIIGSGIAGMTAALYLKRAGVNTLIIEKGMVGGQINRCAQIDNYPGCENIEGPTLAQNMFKQVTNLGIEVKYGEVLSISDEKDYKVIGLTNEKFTCKGIIIATGREPRRLDLPKETELTGRGISWCAVCDGFFFRNKDVAVVGAGNSAIEEALYLSNICHSVKVLVRKDYLRSDHYLQQQISNKANVEVLYETVVTSIYGEDRLDSIEITTKGNRQKLTIQGLFISIGYHPTVQFLTSLGIDTIDDYIVVDQYMRTNMKGIYAAGDAIKKDLYQLVTAASEGAMAANSYIKDYHNGQAIKNS